MGRFYLFFLDVRDPDSLLYIQEYGEGLLFGGYAQKGKPVFTDAVPIKADSEFIQLPEDWDHFRKFVQKSKLCLEKLSKYFNKIFKEVK